jgi:hypothetical protein
MARQCGSISFSEIAPANTDEVMGLYEQFDPGFRWREEARVLETTSILAAMVKNDIASGFRLLHNAVEGLAPLGDRSRELGAKVKYLCRVIDSGH